MSVSHSETDVAPGGARVATGQDESLGGNAARMDDVFHVLQNARRRLVLVYLSDVEGAVEMRAIAEQVAAWENGTTVEAITSEQRQRVYIALYQSHLPKMDELGVVDYDQARGVVERTPQVDQFLSFLRLPDEDLEPGGGTVDENARGVDAEGVGPDADAAGERVTPGDRLVWERYSVLVATAGTVLLAATALDAGPLAGLPDALAGAAILASFVAVTIARAVGDRRTRLVPEE
jgi:hypothetical protein